MRLATIASLGLAALALAACSHLPRVGTHTPGPGLGPGNLGAAGLANDSVDALRVAYGTPQLVRKESDSELWRYDGQNCAAFFFLDTVDGAQHVRFVETLPRGSGAPADGECLRTIRAKASATS